MCSYAEQFCQWCISWLHYDPAEYRERRALCAVYFASWCTPPKFKNLPIAVDARLLVDFKEALEQRTDARTPYENKSRSTSARPAQHYVKY